MRSQGNGGHGIVQGDGQFTCMLLSSTGTFERTKNTREETGKLNFPIQC